MAGRHAGKRYVKKSNRNEKSYSHFSDSNAENNKLPENNDDFDLPAEVKKYRYIEEQTDIEFQNENTSSAGSDTQINTDTKNPKQNNKFLICIIIMALIAIVLALFALFFIPDNNIFSADKETPTIVEETDTLFEETGKVTINDPWLGEIEIDVVKDAKKNSYDPAGFVTDENGIKTYYKDGEQASLRGIDLSEYQGDVDFSKIKKQGFDYVMLRIGGRGYGEDGSIYEDNMFDTYYENADKAGLKIGAYFYSQSVSVDEAIEEADSAVKFLDGRKLAFPIAYDWETIELDDARTDNVENEMISDMAVAFCDRIKEKGFKSAIYAYTYTIYKKYNLEKIKDYDLWVADYSDTPSIYYDFDMWQYTNEATIDGIEGNADLNLCFKNY